MGEEGASGELALLGDGVGDEFQGGGLGAERGGGVSR